MSILHTVLRSAHVEVIDQECRYPRVNCGGGGGEPARFLFTRCGSFAIGIGRQVCLARPGQVVFVGRDVEYRVTHPDQRGCDCCTDVWVDEAWLDALGLAGAKAPACREFPHGLPLQEAHVEMLAGMRRCADAPDAEEAVLAVLDGLLAGDGSRSTEASRAGALRQMRRVEEAILARASENLDLDELARLAGCSPFHLCRIFRQGTGQSLRQFRLQQRLGTALGRLGDGEDDLAALACDMGFSSHSHMIDAFRKVLGESPSEVRELGRRLGSRRRH
jgi:AraC-like DNA-binding protein